MMTITIELTPRQQAALQAAADNHNGNNAAALTAEQFAHLRLTQELDGYATTLRVGLVPPYEFVERFQRLGVYDRIFELAKTDQNVAGYLAILREKRDDVNVFSPTVAQGLAYLAARGVLTNEQVAWVGSLSVPAPAATMPVAVAPSPSAAADTTSP
jgi:hypothetical protein